MINKYFSLIILIGLSFTLNLENIVVSDSSGEIIDFNFYEDKKSALESLNNSFWVESVDGGYNINYDAYMPIAGFQFNLSGIDDISDYEFVNGQVYATEFELQFKNNILLGFSFEGRVLPTGVHTLLELRHHTYLDMNIYKDDKISTNDNTIYIDQVYYDLACSMTENSLYIKDSFVLYNSNQNIGGFQFSIKNGEIIDVNGGDATSANFTLTNSQTTVLGFSFSGDYISSGCGVLTNLGYKGLNVEIDYVIFSDPSGNNLPFNIYNENNFIKDEKIISNDSSINIDITQVVISGRAGQPVDVIYTCHKNECKDYNYYVPVSNPTGLTTLNIRSIGINKWMMSYDSNVDIAGYQFNIEGAKIKSASGGASAINGFTISFKKNTILAFSFKGDVIESGQGDLLEFEVE